MPKGEYLEVYFPDGTAWPYFKAGKLHIREAILSKAAEEDRTDDYVVRQVVAAHLGLDHSDGSLLSKVKEAGRKRGYNSVSSFVRDILVQHFERKE